MKTYKTKRQKEFSFEEIHDHYNSTEPQLQAHVDNMAIDELKSLVMSVMGICPLCEKVSRRVDINIGKYGECFSCPED